MYSKMLAMLVLCSFAVVATSAGSFVCPTSHITKNSGRTGTVPAGASAPIKVPAGQQCIYTFDVPPGFALKVLLTTNYEVSPGDSIRFDGYITLSGWVDYLDYAMNPLTTFEVVSVTGNLTFLIKYEYLDLTHYQQVLKPTGAFFNTTLEANKYYTIKATNDNDQVNLQYGSVSNGISDGSVSDVFIFDGPDIFNSKYVGCVQRAFHRHGEYYSSSNTLTLINLYRSPSYSVFLGNDASAVESMDFYALKVVDASKPLISYMELTTEPRRMPDAWYTVICYNCASFTIDYLMFEDHLDSNPADPKGYVSVQKMTPTRHLPTLATYPYSTNNNSTFPQRITAQMATFHLHNAEVDFKVSPVV